MKVGKKVRNRLFPVLLAVIMAFSMTPSAVFGADGDASTGTAARFSDMPDNWSTEALQKAVSNGLLGGDGGKILPDQNLTRAQMAAVITRAFGAAVGGDLSGFTDVKQTDWFADSLAKAYQMGVIKGSGSQMNPNSAITRQEVFVILARAFKLQSAETMNKTFGDAGRIDGWAKGEVCAFVNAGYIQGSNGELNPAKLITRAEFAQIFDNTIKQYITKAGEYTQIADGNVMVNVPGVTLKNLKVNGDLFIGDGVGDGEVTLDSVAVTGRMVIRGGGENSIIIKGSSSVSNVVVARVDGAVSVKVQGDAKVEVLYIDDGSDDVSIQGTFGNIEVAAPEIVVKAVGATINNIAVEGEGAKLVVDSASKVSSVTIQAPNTQISGTGTVTRVEAQTGSTGSKIETPNTQISVGAGVSGVSAGGGTKLEPGTTTNNNSSGSGTTGPTAPPNTNTGGGHHGDETLVVNDLGIVNDTTVKFNCNAAGGTIKWNGAALSGVSTQNGANTVTVPAAALGSKNTLEITLSGYTTYTNNAVYRDYVKNGAELMAVLASSSPAVKLGADMSLTDTLSVNRAVSIDGGGYSINQTVAVTADNVTIKNLKGTLNTRTQHKLTGIGSATAFYVQAKNAVLDGVTVDGSKYTPAVKDEPTIGIIGFNGAELTVKNSTLSALKTGVFIHIGYTLGAQNTFTATGNTFTNVWAGIGGTEKTTASITGNTFTSVQSGGEGIGLGAGVLVSGAAVGAETDYLAAKNTFLYTAGTEAKVRDYRPSGGEAANATSFTVTSLALGGWTFKSGDDALTSKESGAGPYTYTVTIPAGVAPLKAGTNEITAVKANYPDSKVLVNYAGSTVSDTAQLLKAISDAPAGDTIFLTGGTYELDKQLNLNKEITLSGKGSVTIKAADSWIGSSSTDKHLIKFTAGTKANPIVMENITIDSDGKAYGLNTYNNACGLLKNITIVNSKGAALTVNGSTVEAKNLSTNGNAWGAVNVDPGSGVKTPSVFVLTGNGTLAESSQIWSDGANVKASEPDATVTVTASGYEKYRIYDVVKDNDKDTDNDDYYMWYSKLTNAATIGKVIYPSVYEAVSRAKAGDTVLIAEGTYDLPATLAINKEITVTGANKQKTVLRGGAAAGSVTLNGGATLSNLTVTRDNSGDDAAWDKSGNLCLVTLSNLSKTTTLENCIITKGRNGVYMNTAYTVAKDTTIAIPVIKNNTIEDNRTGINFCGDCSHAVIESNDIINNWTLGIVTYSNDGKGTALDTVVLKDNRIEGNWYGQILVKFDGGVPPKAGAEVTGILDVSTNTFDEPITISHKDQSSIWVEPKNIDLRPESAGGTAKKPSGTPPTLRVYNQPSETGFSGGPYPENTQ